MQTNLKQDLGCRMEDNFVSLQNETHKITLMHLCTRMMMVMESRKDKLSERQTQQRDLHLDQEDRHALIHNKWLSDKHFYICCTDTTD